MYGFVSSIGNKCVAQIIKNFRKKRFPLTRNRSWTYPWHAEIIYKNGRQLRPWPISRAILPLSTHHLLSEYQSHCSASLKRSSSSSKNKSAADWRNCYRHGWWISTHPSLLKTSCLVTQLLTNQKDIRLVPAGVSNLSSANGSSLKRGYIRFHLALGDITLPVEVLVLPVPGPNKMLLEDSIMGAFRAVLNWHKEEPSSKMSQDKK